MTSFDIDPALLPAPGEAPRCAEHFEDHAIIDAPSMAGGDRASQHQDRPVERLDRLV